MTPLKATLLDDERFSVLAIPFGGPIPDRGKGRDLDAEWFSPRTDIKADWFTERPVLWHHGQDSKLGTTVLGKATDLREEDDGWWVDVWVKHGEKRLDLIRRVAERTPLFGSSGTMPQLMKKARTGEILVWPYIEQTLSTSPQNTFSVLRSAKAALDDFDEAGLDVPHALRDLLPHLDVLRDLDPTPSGDGPAKAGREISAKNLAEIEEWLETLKNVTGRADTIIQRVRERYLQAD